jgi:hypothetical protein
MKCIKKFLLNIYIWYFWHNLHCALRHVLGHKTLASSLKEMRELETVIREKNNLKPDEKITSEHKKVELEVFVRYETLKHFNEVGELLAFFKSVDKNKILEAC